MSRSPKGSGLLSRGAGHYGLAMALCVISVTVDSTDPIPLAQWWAEQLGAEISATNDGWFVIVSGGNAPVQLAFQKVDEVTPGKNRWHLDLGASDRLAEVARLEAAGARAVEEHTMGDFTWSVLADPQGNLFCVAPH